jgi:hypothetical protein
MLQGFAFVFLDFFLFVVSYHLHVFQFVGRSGIPVFGARDHQSFVIRIIQS